MVLNGKGAEIAPSLSRSTETDVRSCAFVLPKVGRLEFSAEINQFGEKPNSEKRLSKLAVEPRSKPCSAWPMPCQCLIKTEKLSLEGFGRQQHIIKT
jgi:hypothetical protein